MTAMFPGAIPELPTQIGEEVEYLKLDGDRYRFKMVGPKTWLVHRAGDHSYEGRLEKDGTTFDYSVKHGLGNGIGTGISYGELFQMFL